MIRKILTQRAVWLSVLGALWISAAHAQDGAVDLFADNPKLAPGFLRLGAWNMRHINVEGGADEVLPGRSRDQDFQALIATFAKSIGDLGLDIVAVIEHQPHPGEANRLQQLAQKLNSGQDGPWKWDESNIE